MKQYSARWVALIALLAAATLHAQDPQFLSAKTDNQRCTAIETWLSSVRGGAQRESDFYTRRDSRRPVDMNHVQIQQIWEFAVPGFPANIGKEFLDLTPKERKHLAKWLRRCTKKEGWVETALAGPIADRRRGLVAAFEKVGKEPLRTAVELRDGWFIGAGIDGVADLTVVELKNGNIRFDLQVSAVYPGPGSRSITTTGVVLLLDGDGNEVTRILETVTTAWHDIEREEVTIPRAQFGRGVYLAMLTKVENRRISTVSSNVINTSVPGSLSKHVEEFLATGIEDLKAAQLAPREQKRIGYWMCRRLR